MTTKGNGSSPSEEKTKMLERKGKRIRKYSPPRVRSEHYTRHRLGERHKTRNDFATAFSKFLKTWTTTIATVIALGTLIWGVYQFNAQQAANQAQALDQQQQATLDTYLDRISDLLLTYPDHFKAYIQGDQYQVIAEARTFTAVRNLDGLRKGTLVRFLWEAGLISGSPPIISLSGANLSEAIFSGGSLNSGGSAHLPHTVISAPNGQLISTGADLSGADLSGAILVGAYLSGADLSGADLSGADLKGAKYNTKPMQGTNAQGNPITLEPTQWPQGFNPQAAGATCDDC